jgi:hypothetical protein
MSFTPTDAVSILSRTPSFIFLDGLDEVPDVKLRGAIVESCQASLNRLESLGADLQVLVTSRPAIFVKAPAFPDDKFEYMNLSELTRPLISSYAGAWMRVRQIPEEQGSEIMQVLDASISQSHVAELARNPMQLAILLWLISVKGRSLPDQRTALYDQYLTAFLDREAVKNSIVRTHRARLLEIHGFLGWVLHGRAESDDSRFAGGDISAEELRDLLHDYLVHEERPTDLVHELFEGAERVFVLVSRIEGKFEFEVQPLREFFAARYLYKTAPRSTYAQPAKGTRPDRLRQLVRNPYWLNVARFFCGWYDRGELADLTRQLKDLCEDPEFSHLSYPRLLIAYILRDCTTAESQRDTRELVETMTDPTGLRFLSTRTSDLKGELSSSGALFPEDCGQQLFVEKLRDAVVNTHTHEIRTDLAQAIRENDRSDLRAAWWLTLKGDARLSHTQWLMRGAETGSIGYISLDAALEIFDPRTATQLDWIRCVEGGRFDVAFHDDERFKCFIAALGDGFTPLVPVSPMGECGRIGSYGQIFNLSSMRTSRATYAYRGSRGLENDPVVSNEMMECIRPLDSLMRVAMQQVSLGGSRAYLRQLSSIIEAAEATFGQSWMCWELALYGATAAGCPAGKRTGFQNSSAPMLSRARQARLAVLDKGYWMDVASSVPESKGLRKAGIAAALSWADPAVLMEVLPYFARRWDDLQQYDIRSIARVLDGLLIVTGSGPSKPKNISKEIILHLPDLPASLLSLLYYRTHHDADPALLRKIKHAYENGEVAENHRSLVASLLLHYNEVIWDGKRSVLSSIRKYFEETTYGSFSGLSNENAYPHTRASETILAAPMSFPMSLVSMADQEVAEIVTGRLRPLRDIALEEDWFNGLQY